MIRDRRCVRTGRGVPVRGRGWICRSGVVRGVRRLVICGVFVGVVRNTMGEKSCMYFRNQVPKIQGKKSSVCCFFLSNNVNQFLRQSPFAVISSVKFENSRSFGRFGRGEVNWCGTAEAAAAAGADWGVRLLCRGIFLKILWHAGSGRRAGWRGECAGECGGSAIGGRWND